MNEIKSMIVRSDFMVASGDCRKDREIDKHIGDVFFPRVFKHSVEIDDHNNNSFEGYIPCIYIIVTSATLCRKVLLVSGDRYDMVGVNSLKRDYMYIIGKKAIIVKKT